ncbi:MAG: DNA alkylation repair protein [Alphaproteobacteria bacterium]|nr:DNA alkylation repair protein [Alphaproteobacteria bacterium]
MEPFKNRIGPAAVAQIARLVPGDWDRAGFTHHATTGLAALELKDRVAHIADALHATLPWDYPTAVGRILDGLPPMPEHTDRLTDAFELWPLTAFVERHGLAHPDVSLAAMPALTGHWSCEFAIRPYFRDDPEGVAKRLEGWAEHPNAHVRRLVSEGTRPRLPWGIRLQDRIERPQRMLPLLERLRDDPSEYVRRSVANHLNDIAKDHPDLLVEIAGSWLRDAPATRRKLVKHALRTQIKACDPRAYGLIGLRPFEGTVRIAVSPGSVAVGEAVTLTAELVSTAKRAQRVRLDYAVHHLRKNGGRTPKVFHWTERTVKPGETLTMAKAHPMREVSTRRYYPGAQAIDLRVNGEATEALGFTLRI